MAGPRIIDIQTIGPVALNDLLLASERKPILKSVNTEVGSIFNPMALLTANQGPAIDDKMIVYDVSAQAISSLSLGSVVDLIAVVTQLDPLTVLALGDKLLVFDISANTPKIATYEDLLKAVTTLSATQAPSRTDTTLLVSNTTTSIDVATIWSTIVSLTAKTDLALTDKLLVNKTAGTRTITVGNWWKVVGDLDEATTINPAVSKLGIYDDSASATKFGDVSRMGASFFTATAAEDINVDDGDIAGVYLGVGSTGVPTGDWSTADKPTGATNVVDIATTSKRIFLADGSDGIYSKALDTSGVPTGTWSAADGGGFSGSVRSVAVANSKVYMLRGTVVFYKGLDTNDLPTGSWSSQSIPSNAAKPRRIDVTSKRIYLTDQDDGLYHIAVDSNGAPTGGWTLSGKPASASGGASGQGAVGQDGASGAQGVLPDQTITLNTIPLGYPYSIDSARIQKDNVYVTVSGELDGNQEFGVSSFSVRLAVNPLYRKYREDVLGRHALLSAIILYTEYADRNAAIVLDTASPYATRQIALRNFLLYATYVLIRTYILSDYDYYHGLFFGGVIDTDLQPPPPPPAVVTDEGQWGVFAIDDRVYVVTYGTGISYKELDGTGQPIGDWVSAGWPPGDAGIKDVAVHFDNTYTPTENSGFYWRDDRYWRLRDETVDEGNSVAINFANDSVYVADQANGIYRKATIVNQAGKAYKYTDASPAVPVGVVTTSTTSGQQALIQYDGEVTGLTASFVANGFVFPLPGTSAIIGLGVSDSSIVLTL